MFRGNKNLIVVSIIMLINSLGYGIIIPIIYTYSIKFGLNDFQNGLLFAIFSLCQFLATPVIGRLSDKYGRKPLLVLSLAGTAVSFFLAAFAPNAIILFLARALDGVTSGNIPVASAVISDTTKPKDRARGFGIIGASFGFGFVFGPAIAALTLPFGINAPFIVAGIVTTVSVFVTMFFLSETNQHIGQVREGKLFDFKKLFTSITDKDVGMTLLISLIYAFAFALFIFAFQPFAVKSLDLSPNMISIIYTIYGVVGLIAQAVILPRLVPKLGEKKMIVQSFFIITLSFAAIFFTETLPIFIGIAIIFGLANAFINPLIQTLLSKETDEKSQGTVLGLNQSYISLGFIFGPIVGGALATISIPLPFLLGSFLAFICLILAIKGLKTVYTHKISEF